MVKARSVRRLLWLAGFACLWLPVLDDPPLQTGAYLQDVGAEAATIAMITASPIRLTCKVEDGGRLVAQAEEAVPRRRHAMRVTGLKPGHDHVYTVAVEGRAIATGRIRTAPADDAAPVRFALLGDSGALPWWVWLQTSPAMYWPARWRWFGDARNVTAIGREVAASHPDFLLHVGDIVYPWGWNAHYGPGFFGPFAAVIRDAPAYLTLGNHDVLDCGGLQALANFPQPRGSSTGDSRCFTFAWGSVRVIVLDCDPDHGLRRYEPGHPAHDFLARELPRCSEPWIVVASHFPIRSASRQRNRADLMLGLLPVLQEHDVSLYLAGHDHCYQRFGTGTDGSVPQVVSGGGGKSLYEVRPDPAAAALASRYHWCSVEAAGRRLLLQAHDLDGRSFDRLELSLPSGGRFERLRERNAARAARIAALPGG